MPLVSVFTPTHKPDYLDEAYQSLLRQDFEDFQWVILPNGGCTEDQLASFRHDPRVVIMPHLPTDGAPQIGRLKRLCCEHATGEILVELDHDDMLAPNTLSKVITAVENGAGFVHSDAAIFREKADRLIPEIYSSSYGWNTYPIRVYGRDLVAIRSFDVEPRVLSDILFAPDHVRCWTREAYFRAGGHDPDLPLADDLDLICRTYESHAVFAHTGHCGYLYRSHPRNTFKEHNKDLHKLVKKLQRKHLPLLIREWLRRERLLESNVGSPDVIRQLSLLDAGMQCRFDYPDNHFGCLKAYDLMPRIPKSHVAAVLSEFYRVLIPRGWLLLAFPVPPNEAAYMLDHATVWTETNLKFLSDLQYAARLPGFSHSFRFQLVEAHLRDARPDDALQYNGPYVFASLQAMKSSRQAGLTWI